MNSRAEDTTMNAACALTQSGGIARLRRSLGHAAALIAGLAMMAAVAGAAQAQTAPVSAKAFSPAAVKAKPGLRCELRPAGDNAAKAALVFTDSDGYARFHAMRANADAPRRKMIMACADLGGRSTSYSVDLSAAATFAPHPLDIMKEPGVTRPALAGDPLGYSQEELIHNGYGLRPDPAKSPDAYGRWLAAAKSPGRILANSKTAIRSESVRPDTVTVTQAPNWTGSALTGAPNYDAVEGNISVPLVAPNGDETGNVHEAVWNGLGGYGTGSGLIQGGYQIDVTNGVLTYFTFREYCCGNPVSNSYSGNFDPNPGDIVYSEEWYCNSKGSIHLNGGYGCTHLHDLTTGAILDCSSATNGTCPSVPALPLCSAQPSAPNCETVGKSAEFVIELQGPAFADTLSEVTLTGSAYASTTNKFSQTISNDPGVNLLTDFTNTTSHMTVSLGKTNQTYFNVSQFKQVSGSADNAASAEGIAVGPNGNGSSIGDPWALGLQANASGDRAIYHWVNGAFVQVSGAATQIAVSPTGTPWVINHTGAIFSWNGSSFSPAPGNACATRIAVGAQGPWILGCHELTNGYGIYRLQGGSWVSFPGEATKIAIGSQGPWIIQKPGNVAYWNGANYIQAPGNPCATNIAAAPISPFNDSNGDVWITGCTAQSSGYNIFQLQGNAFVQIPGQANEISISPDLGVPWIVDKKGNIFE